MKVLIINSWENEGGAARAANRLHKAYLRAGIDSNMLVMKKNTSSFTVINPFNKFEQEINKLLPNIAATPIFFYNKTRIRTLFSTQFMSRDLSKIINDINPDIIHIHWFNAGFMSLKTLLNIKKPILWSLHDMWAFTGGCHYDIECGRYKDECGYCKVLGSKKQNDLSLKEYKKKKNIYDKLDNLNINGLSKWIFDTSKSSSLLKYKKHFNLPNLIDINEYRPLINLDVRSLWKFPKDKKLILFGALFATSETRKGFKYILESLGELDRDNIELIIFGSDKPKEEQNFKFKAHYLGNIFDDISLITLYNCADVMIVPSLQENLSNAIMESLSCGTPVVAFDIGGNSDMIDHKENGYLAKPFDSKDLACGIEYVLNFQGNNLRKNARQKVLENFSEEIVVSKYLNCYKDII